MATGFRLSALDKQKQRYGMLWYDMVCYGTTGWIEKNTNIIISGVHSGITQMLSPAMFLYSLTRQTKIQSQITKIASTNHNLSLQIIRKNTLNHHLTKHCLNECGLHVINYGADNVETCNCSCVLK